MLSVQLNMSNSTMEPVEIKFKKIEEVDIEIGESITAFRTEKFNSQFTRNQVSYGSRDTDRDCYHCHADGIRPCKRLR